MKTISGYYNDICTKKYQSLGFFRNRLVYARIIGDVLQAFTLRCSRGASTCSVEFGIFPLCMPQPIFLDAGGYTLDEFFAELPNGSSGWTFDPGSKERMISCVEFISKAIDLYEARQ